LKTWVVLLATVSFGLCMGLSIGSFKSLIDPDLSLPWDDYPSKVN